MHIKYPNITFLVGSVLAAGLLAYFGVFEKVLGGLGEIGYLGAFVAGILFPITFTSPIAVVALYYLGVDYGVAGTVIFGAIGAVIGDYIIFTFVKDRTLKEIEEIRREYRLAHKNHGHHRRHVALLKLFHSKPFHALALFVGGLLIVLPTPDEFGVAIFASYKLNSMKFIPLSLVLNAVSVWMVAYAGAVFGS